MSITVKGRCKQTDETTQIHCSVVVIHFEMCKVPKLIKTKANNKNINMNSFQSLHVSHKDDTAVLQKCFKHYG